MNHPPMFHHLTYALLDAARMNEQMDIARAFNKKHDSLYRGGSEVALPAIAPYIFQFAHPTPFSNWMLKNGWGDAWGVMIKSSWPMPELYKHFRKFLTVKTEEGRSLYFRFYDPRVLRVFLPTCDTAQLRDFFGNGAIDYFLMEDEDAAFAIRLWHENGFLKNERIAVADLIAALPDVAPPAPAQDKLTPETQAVIEELRKQYPDVEFPGDGQQQRPAAGKEPPAKPAIQQPAQPAKPAFKPKPAFSPLDTNEPAPAKSGGSDAAKEEQHATEEAPKPKTKWNMFD